MVNKRENKEVLSLVAKLRNSFNDINSTVLGWIGDNEGSNERPEELKQSKKEFFTLPLIATGAGLSFHESKESEDINTVGEFVHSDKKVNSLSKKRKKSHDRLHLHNNSNNIYKVSKDDSKAMLALKRRMRKGKLEKMRQDPSSSMRGPMQRQPILRQFNDEDEDEDDPRIERTKKKSIGLLFENSNKKRKGKM